MLRGWNTPADLCRDFGKGDLKASDELFNYLYRLIASKYQKSLSLEDCEDIAQETLIDALENLSKIEEPKFFLTWISKIAFNKAFHLCKRRGTGEDRRETELITEIPDKDDFVRQDSIAQVIWRLSLSQEMKQLKPNELEALRLTKIENLSYEEAAKKSSRTKDSIAQAVSGACRKLRKVFGDRRVD